MLEDSVLSWSHQIKAGIATDPEALLKEASHPGALRHVDFWRTKATALNLSKIIFVSPNFISVPVSHDDPKLNPDPNPNRYPDPNLYPDPICYL